MVPAWAAIVMNATAASFLDLSLVQMPPKRADLYQLRSAANALLPFLVHYYHVASLDRASVYLQNPNIFLLNTSMYPFKPNISMKEPLQIDVSYRG